jgi:hypothetical protein
MYWRARLLMMCRMSSSAGVPISRQMTCSWST